MKMLRGISFIFILVFRSGVLFATPFLMISPGDPVLEQLRYVARESGRSLLSFTPPLSRDEALQILDGIDPQGLSAAGRRAYAEVRLALSPEPRLRDGAFGFSWQPRTALEGRFRTDADLEWTRREATAPSFVSLPLEFFFGDIFYAAGALVLRTDPTFYDDQGSPWGTNIPYETRLLDLNMPLRAFVSSGGPWWSFQLGRDKASFGTGVTGNLALSDTPDYYDFARLSLFSPNFKYSLFVAQVPLATADLFADAAAEPDDALGSTVQRYFYLHRFDLRFWRRLSVGIGEGVMVGNSPPELRFLNPLTMYHSYFAWRDYPSWGDSGDMVGSLFALDLEWAIVPSLALYGQFSLNEYATPYELENWPDAASPNGLGYLGGLEYVRSLDGWRSRFNLEAVYTDPYAYQLSSPFASFIWMRRLSELDSKALRYAWIGHPEGRDTALLYLGAAFSREPLAFSGGLTLAAKGEHADILWDWTEGAESSSLTAPSGTAENRIIASTAAEWRPMPSLTLGTYAAGILVWNAEHDPGSDAAGIELGFSVQYAF